MDIYQSITDKIVRQLESNPGTWTMPWRTTGINQMPRSADGRAYRGVNILVLWGSAIEHGYTCPVWATYKQWAKHGCQVQKGQKAEMVVFWKKLEVATNDSEEPEARWMARAYFVFNVAQTDGASRFPVAVHPGELKEFTDRIIEIDDFFINCQADIRRGGDKAYYSPAHDFIGIPDERQFESGHDYYSTLGHEHIHWTGAKHRLDRELNTTRFGNEAYAYEELVAELGAAFLCAHLNLENEPREDHAQYLASWLRVLKNDKKAIFMASSKAQLAMDYLLGFQPGGDESTNLTEEEE